MRPDVFPYRPEIRVLANRRSDTNSYDRADSLWHTDVTFVANPPMASILRGVAVPEYGGDTQWTNLVAAYNDLSETVRTTIDGLHAVHRNVLPSKGDGPASEQQKAFQSKD